MFKLNFERVIFTHSVIIMILNMSLYTVYIHRDRHTGESGCVSESDDKCDDYGVFLNCTVHAV